MLPTIHEALYRLKEPRSVASHALRRTREAFARLGLTRFDRLYRSVSDITMVSHARLKSLYESVRYLNANAIPGDIVECGVAAGGSAALMALASQPMRQLWLCDTFTGLPSPSPADPAIAAAWTGTCLGSPEEIFRSFARLGIELAKVKIIPGLFEETLADSPIGNIALLHVDGDWYQSVKATLEALYDRVSPGGIIQFDDYGHWSGARRAVDEFLRGRHFVAKLEYVDFSGRRMFKPA